MRFNTLANVRCFLCVAITLNVEAQSAKDQCSQNIEFLRQDLISMLEKTPAMPPLAQMYVAARERFDDIQTMRGRGDYQGCVSESKRVLQITRPYGNR